MAFIEPDLNSIPLSRIFNAPSIKSVGKRVIEMTRDEYALFRKNEGPFVASLENIEREKRKILAWLREEANFKDQRFAQQKIDEVIFGKITFDQLLEEIDK